MNYDALSRNTLKITLTEQDMRNYSIKSDCIVKRNAETKRTLTRFLKKFQAQSSFFSGMSAERLFLEAFPSKDGGCVLYVSTLGCEKPLTPESAARPGLMMCNVDQTDDMIKLCACIAALSPGCECTLYRLGDGYRLVADAHPDVKRKLIHIMEEYGQLSSDDTEIAYVAEHGKVICEEDTAAKIAALL